MDARQKLERFKQRMLTKTASTDYLAAMCAAAREEGFTTEAIELLLDAVQCIGAQGGPPTALLDALDGGVTT